MFCLIKRLVCHGIVMFKCVLPAAGIDSDAAGKTDSSDLHLAGIPEESLHNNPYDPLRILKMVHKHNKLIPSQPVNDILCPESILQNPGKHYAWFASSRPEPVLFNIGFSTVLAALFTLAACVAYYILRSRKGQRI